MKRKLAILICITMLVTFIIPSFALAEGDKGLENAIKSAKSMFTIPADFNFNYQMNMENGKRVWALSWNSKDGSKGGINIRIDDNGTIYGYDNYKPFDTTQKKLPKLSRKDAGLKADAFIKKINPKILGQIKLQANTQSASVSDYTYNFYYVRTVNKILFYQDSINVSINKDTGEVVSYYLNWTDGLLFPSGSKTISIKDANTSYEKNLGLKLVYKYTTLNDKIKTYPAYIPVYGDNYSIDAFTGNKVITGYSYGIYPGGMAVEKSSAMSRADQAPLTPDEVKAIEEASKLISKDDAEKIARDCANLKLTDSYKLSYINLTRGWPTKDDIFWQLSFASESTDSSKPADSMSVSINAKTGEITSFYLNPTSSDKDSVEFDEAASKVAVDEFLKSFSQDKYNQVEYYDNSINNPVTTSTEPVRNYNFTYLRKVNGIQFPDNSISIGFDAVSGEITNYSITWFDTDFAKLDKVISMDKAYEKLFGQVGLELQYKTKYSDDYYKKINLGVVTTEKPTVILVYSLTNTKPAILDAYTGTILDYDGNPYKAVNTVAYTDIKGHYAQKQIEILGEYGISLEGSKFRPDEKITQKDYLILISKIMTDYYGPIITASSKSTDVDSFYGALESQNILKDSEKSPNKILTKEDGVKYFIRAIKYDKVADIKGIFKCSFKDAGSITPSLYGYFAIAQGLKIIGADKNGNISPKAGLTRAETMVMIYNYLNR